MELQDKLKNITAGLGIEYTPLFEIDRLTHINNDSAAVHKAVNVFKDLEVHDGGITLIPLSDIHLGSVHTDRKKLNAVVDYILNTQGCYTVLLGDAAETATKVSVGMGLYEEDMHLRKQLIELSNILRPLADAGKILGIHTGNHEFRCAVLTGLNPMEMLARELRVPYLGYQGYHVLYVGKQKYHMSTNHGVGSGKTTGAKTNAAERASDISPLCHLYLSGHTHIRSVHDKVKYHINEKDELVALKQYFVVCGNFLDYFGGYAEMQLLSPASTGVVHIKFFADSHNIRASL